MAQWRVENPITLETIAVHSFKEAQKMAQELSVKLNGLGVRYGSLNENVTYTYSPTKGTLKFNWNLAYQRGYERFQREQTEEEQTEESGD